MTTLDTISILYSISDDEGRTWTLRPEIVIPVTAPISRDAARELVASLSSLPLLRLLSVRLDDSLGVTELVDPAAMTEPDTAPWDPDGTPF
jgi:hypothetical protein